MSNKNSHLNNRYMLSAFDKKEIRWIRHPFMSKYQLNRFLFDYAKNPYRYERLEIFMEPTLNTKVLYETTDSKENSSTLREYLFGSFYQENVLEYETNEEFRNLIN